jgi:hypothetical protein
MAQFNNEDEEEDDDDDDDCNNFLINSNGVCSCRLMIT